MLTLILAASIGQIYAKDFHFMKAQEDWVIDNRPQGAGYMWYIDKSVNARVEMWRDPCARCQKRALAEISDMGPDALRPMFWTARARDQGVAYYSRIVIGRLRRCTVCKGTGECPGFEDEDVPTAVCKNCDHLKFSHDDEGVVRECLACDGRGCDMRIPGDYKP